MPNTQFDISTRRMLLADWFTRLASESGLSVTQTGASRDASSQAFTLGTPGAFYVTANFTDAPPFLNFVADDPSQQSIVNAMVVKAVERVERGDLGGIVWYSTKLPEIELKLFTSKGSFFERIGRQTRITGWRRLGTHILLEFSEDLPADWNDKSALFAPKALVHVHIAAPAPCRGYLSSRLAHSIVETVAAICTFALGRSVALPLSVRPSESEMLSQLAARQTDHSILTLARKGISLDIASPFTAPGGFDLFSRTRAALLTFDAAVRQEHESVACILYVVAAECLTTPYTEWRHSKLTKRFIEFFEDLMPTDLDQIIQHGNFEEAFGIRRGTRTPRALRRELLTYIYDYRSGQLHQGLRPNYVGFGGSLDLGGEIRRGLFADFAEQAILQYLAAPRASLVGHPAFD